MERTHKTWGTKWLMFQNSTCEVSVLDLNPSQRCSWHFHKTKWNQFFVIRGELFIKTEWGVEKVEQGQVITVRPGEWHEFQTHTLPALVQETMYVTYDPEDIQRETLGGPLDEGKDAG